MSVYGLVITTTDPDEAMPDQVLFGTIRSFWYPCVFFGWVFVVCVWGGMIYVLSLPYYALQGGAGVLLGLLLGIGGGG